jgi:DHA2 family multidrug resistance protein
MMPIVGKLLQKGIPQQYLAALGMSLFAGFCFFGYSILTPSTGTENFTWMLIIRGVGMGFLFVPITSLSLSSLKGQQIGQGAAFTGMMRQLGGSFGVAIITTMLARQGVFHRNTVIAHLGSADYNVQSRLAGMKASFIAKGLPPNLAEARALHMLDLSVMRQTSVLSYMDIFLYLGVLFTLCVPVLLFIRNKKGQKFDPKAAAAAH